ncbi:MAG: peptidylprolyl isomerase, partial [Sphingomonadales bacterium]
MSILNNFEKSKFLTVLFAGFMVIFLFMPGSEDANSQQQVIQKIEALVNDDVITAFDVGQRMGLVLLGTGRTLSSQEELLELRAQVLETLINEKLEIQEALEFDVPVPEEELFEVYGRVARSYNRTEENFEELLQNYGTSTAAILQQIEAEYAWQTLVNGRYSSYVEAKDEEIEQILADMQANAGKREYRLSEIFLISSDPTQDDRVRETAQRIREQMGDAFRFGEMARQFSQSTTSAQGGDLGWISESQMAPEIMAALKDMEILDVSQPIKTPGGYYLVALTDRRSILSPEPLDEVLAVRQIGWFFTQETTEATATDRPLQGPH